MVASGVRRSCETAPMRLLTKTVDLFEQLRIEAPVRAVALARAPGPRRSRRC